MKSLAVLMCLLAAAECGTDQCQCTSTTTCTIPESRSRHQPFVAFSMASSNSLGRLDTPTLIPLEDALYNTGGYFDTTANVFRAPVHGVYSFTFGGACASGKALSLHLYRQKKGVGEKIQVAMAYDKSTTMLGGASGACMVELDAKDTMSLWMYGDVEYVHIYKLYGADMSTDGDTWSRSTLFSGKLEHRLAE